MPAPTSLGREYVFQWEAASIYRDVEAANEVIRLHGNGDATRDSRVLNPFMACMPVRGDRFRVTRIGPHGSEIEVVSGTHAGCTGYTLNALLLQEDTRLPPR